MAAFRLLSTAKSCNSELRLSFSTFALFKQKDCDKCLSHIRTTNLLSNAHFCSAFTSCSIITAGRNIPVPMMLLKCPNRSNRNLSHNSRGKSQQYAYFLGRDTFRTPATRNSYSFNISAKFTQVLNKSCVFKKFNNDSLHRRYLSFVSRQSGTSETSISSDDELNNSSLNKKQEQIESNLSAADGKEIRSSLDDITHSVRTSVTPTKFEYDYQVAEDIEEYDYIDESKLLEQQIRPEKVLPISLQRGTEGVFDLEELLTLLNHLGAEDIVAFPVPESANFCDNMVIVSAKSKRHMQALIDELYWVHKRKKSSTDQHLLIEGFGVSDWSAMDMGNIVLHIFYGESRDYYDIESLWTLGPDNDPKCKEQAGDPYALSAEDLFWMNVGGKPDEVNDTVNKKADPEGQKKL